MDQLCGICGGRPAGFATFRAAIVILIGIRVQTRAGLFCRACGLAVFREQQKLTLAAGWWGIPALAAPITLLLNLNNLQSLERLPPPQFPPEAPVDAGPRYGRPLPPGKPVSQSAVIAVPIVLFGLLLVLCCGGRFLS